MFLLFCGLFRCFRNGHKVTPFNVHPCGLRPAECKRHHCGGKPPPRPPPLSYPCLSRFPAGFPTSCGFPVPADFALRRARLTVCTMRTVFAEYRRFPAVGFAVRFTKRGRRPAEKLRTKEIRDNCPNITNFLCQQTYITISTKYTGDNQPLKSLSLHL